MSLKTGVESLPLVIKQCQFFPLHVPSIYEVRHCAISFRTLFGSPCSSSGCPTLPALILQGVRVPQQTRTDSKRSPALDSQ